MVEDISILFVLFCAALGAGGQLIRSVIGVYKIYNDPTKGFKLDWKWMRFFMSLAIGAMVGALLSLIYNSPLAKTDILGIVAASYGGADFLEGFLKNRGEQVK